MKITCPQCGFNREIPDDKIPENSVIAKCPRCACRFRFSRKQGPGEIIPAMQDNASEEEDIRVHASNAYMREARRFENEQKARSALNGRDSLFNPWDAAPEPDGWLAAFYQTIIRVMFQAQNFFRNLAPQAQIWRPLAFFIIICVIQSCIERGWSDVFYSFLSGETSSDPQLENLLKMLAPVSSLPLLILLRTGSLLLQLFVFSLLMYFAYRLIAPGKATFMLVYQILAYSASPWLLCVVPGLGSLAGTIWSIGCLAVGCKSAMNLTWAQTIIGFLPLLAMVAPLFQQFVRLMG